jgi:hypothetical protein
MEVKMTAPTRALLVLRGVAVAAALGLPLPSAAQIVVSNTDDVGAGSLREAITAANAAPGATTIVFNIGPGDPGFVDEDGALPGGDLDPDVFVIALASALPSLTNPDGITIDGGSQTTFGGDTNPFGPEIAIDGGGVVSGLSLSGASHHLLGLNLRAFTGDGVLVQGGGNVLRGNFIGTDSTGTVAMGNGNDGVEIRGAADNVIGGTGPGDGNVISGNGADGIRIRDAGGANNVVQGNRLGTDAAGTMALGNGGDGIEVSGPNNLVGGSDAGAGNLCSGNAAAGIRLFLAATGTVLQGNYVGTDVTGVTAVANGTGVDLTAEARGILIGGTAPGAGNLISGNVGDGIRITTAGSVGTPTGGNMVEGNLIGTDVTGAAPLPNGNGILLDGASDNVVGGIGPGTGNLIAFNDRTGVIVGGIFESPGSGNSILGNSIFANGFQGIDFYIEQQGGPDPNDACDADEGPNGLQNHPTFTSIERAAGQVTVTGFLDSTADDQFRIELFANDECDGSGFGEGEELVASTMVTTDASCRAGFSVTFPSPSGAFLSATATGPDGSTSEFSQCLDRLEARLGQLVSGKKLLLKWRPDPTKKRLVKMLSKDRTFTLGDGPGSVDDPVEAGGSLRVVSLSGDTFDDTYPLPQGGWRYLKAKKPEKGYKFAKGDPIKTVVVKPGRVIKVVGKGLDLGHSLAADPRPVHVELRLGDELYCLTFGGNARFKADKKYLAKKAPTALACPMP